MKRNDTGDRFTYLTTTPIPDLILRLAVPTIISMLITGIYNTADTFFVGQIPDHATGATAAVGLAFPLMATIQAAGFFFGQGSGSYMSRMLGAGKKQEASEMASTGFVLALGTGLLIAGIGNLFLPQIMGFLATDDVSGLTVEMAQSYLRIILLGAPFTLCQFVVNNQLRFQGSAMSAMVGLVSGAVLNMALDPLLILVFRMGVAGAAVATVAGQAVSFTLLLFGTRRGENIRLSIRSIRFSGTILKQIVNGGSPSLVRQGLAAIATMLLNRAAGQFGGDAAIAGMSIVTRILMLLISALIGFGQGYQPVCSFNYGAGLRRRVREGFLFCAKWGFVFLSAVAVGCFVFAPQLVSLFRDDPDVVAVGKVALRCQACVLPLNAVIVMTNMMLQSIGKGFRASVTASARNGIFFIPAILVLPVFFGLTGVEITQTVADICAFLLSVPLAAAELKRMKTDVVLSPHENAR
ncbi:MAG: MATE family efflux transporter [Clostridia bacterium]|nr:MATE family efflux transporter [Clostridia bacterium]